MRVDASVVWQLGTGRDVSGNKAEVIRSRRSEPAHTHTLCVCVSLRACVRAK